MGGHLADDVGIVGDAGGTGVSRPTIRLGGGAGGDVGGKEGVEAGGRVISDLAEADAAGAKPAVFDLDGADDQHFALMAAPATAGDRIILLRQGISVSSTSTRPARGLRPGASVLQRSLAQRSHAVL
jgi:hypothetical protein